MHRSLPQPLPPAGLDACLRIAQRGSPFTSTGGRAFITVPAHSPGGFLSFPTRSRAFRQWFYDQTISDCDSIPTSHTFNATLHYLDALALRHRATNIRVPFRVDSRGTFAPLKILLDLASPDGQFVEITPQGWSVAVPSESEEGVPFETSSSSLTLPAPEPSTDSPLDTLRSTLNLGPPASPDWLRCLAWLLAALRTNGPYPILILRGPSGSGKSLAARILRSLIDPSAAPFTPLPASARQLLTLARLNWVLAFDHVSSLSPAIADTLCRLTSGVGVACREPGLDEPLQLFLKRPILLTVTEDWTPPPDLAARALFVTLPPLTPESRRPDHEVANTIQELFPKILGALCTAVSCALAGPPPRTVSPTRHAAALAWAQAAAPALHCTPEAMLDAFNAPPPPDPFVDAVRQFLDRTPRWSGSALELLKLLPLCKTPQVLARRLKQSILALADAGIDVQFRRLPGGAKVIDLIATQNPPPSSQPEVEQQLIPPPEIPPPSPNCDTTPPVEPEPVGQAASLRAGCLPAQLLEVRPAPASRHRNPHRHSPPQKLENAGDVPFT